MAEPNPSSGTAAEPWPIALADLVIRDSACHFSVLRLGPHDPGLYVALTREFGLDWPARPNTVSHAAATVLWLAPREWAVVGLPADEVGARAARACGATLHHVADAGGGRVQFELSGAHARTVLAKGCSLDLHPRAFAPDACAQSLLAQVPVLLAAGGAAGAWRLWADASWARFLRAWLVDAAVEFVAQRCPPARGIPCR